VLDLARSLGTPADVPVLDLAAGMGRNVLSLAREGFPCDAVEWRPELAELFRAATAKEAQPSRLFEFDPVGATPGEALEPPSAHYRLVFVCDMASDFRDVTLLERLFERAATFVRPGGLFLFNAFVPVGGYQPDRLARELAVVFWSTIFLREELKTAAGAHGFTLISEEGMADYEQARLPAGAWPPSDWFEEWARGVDTFDLPGSRVPVELRWLTYRKDA
jgi:SAM-dependent methyltransferase